MVQLTFENPVYLWFLLSLPLLVLAHFYWLRHTKRKAMKFANFRALKRVTGRKLITKNYALLALRCVTILCAILAAAQTTLWYSGQQNENAYVIAIDTSASMLAQDVQPTRIDAAKEYAKVFVDTVAGDAQFGLVTFSGVTMIEEALTRDKNLIKERIDEVEPIEAGGTDIPGALITSANLLAEVDQGRAIILLTDGSNTLETFVADSVQQGVHYAQKQHAVVHAIGIGTESGPIGYLPTYYNVSAVYNEENLELIANATGGTYHRAETRKALHDAYTAIASESTESLIKRPLGPVLMALALLLILFEWVVASTRFRTIP